MRVAPESSPVSLPTLDLRPRLTVAILGSGVMGQGIAQDTASHGHLTFVYDVEPGRADAAIVGVKAQLAKLA